MAFRDELHNLLPPPPATGTAEQWAKESCEAVKEALRALAKRGEMTDVAGVPKLKYFYEIPHPFMENKFMSKMIDGDNGIFFKKKKLLQYWDTTTAVHDPQFKAYIGTVTNLLRKEGIQALCVIKDTVTQQCKPADYFEKDTTTGEPKLGLLCETAVSFR